MLSHGALGKDVYKRQVQEIQLERSNQRGKVGNIYLGKVTRVLPGMQSAFIDIGLERAAFMHIADLRENRESRLNDNVQVHIDVYKRQDSRTHHLLPKVGIMVYLLFIGISP